MSSKVYASKYTMEALKAMVEAKSQADVGQDYDVYVRRLDGPLEASPKSEFEEPNFVGHKASSSSSKRTIPRHSESGQKQSRGRPGTMPQSGTSEIHDLIQKIDELIAMLDEKEKRLALFGPIPYQPLNSRYRKNIDDVLYEGDIILDHLKYSRHGTAARPETRYLKEHELKSVLFDLRQKLIQQLPPAERRRHESQEKEKLKKQMEDVEGRIMDIIYDIEQNEKTLNSIEKKKAEELANQSIFS